MKKIKVVAAVVKHEGRILCVQRGENKYEYISKKFEFPGGKIEEGESEEQALEREIIEELSLEITIQDKFVSVHHSYPDFALEMHSYLCSSKNRNIILHEHINAEWMRVEDLKKLDWAAADIPIVDKLMC